MPYNGSGTFTLSQPAFVPNTPIASAAVNSDLSDIATGLTTAITKDGQTTITAAIKFANGAVGLPAMTFASDANTGIYRVSADVLGLSAGGTLILSVATTGITITGSFSPSGQLLEGADTVSLPGYSWASDPDSGMYRIGANNVGVAVNATKILDISTTGLNVIGTIQSNGATLSPISFGSSMVNGTIVASVSANALTVAIKTLSGADPSSVNPVFVNFRDVTNATGDYVTFSVTAATSIVISSGSTMGTTSNIPFRLYLVGFNDASTFRLALINSSTATQIFPLNESVAQSATNEGGAGAADAAGIFYAGATVTAKAMRLLGYLDFSSGQATPGSWATAPDIIQLFALGTRKPGDIVQSIWNQTGAVATGTTIIPLDDTIPQNTEGDQYLTQAITPSSKVNILEIECLMNMSSSALLTIIAALFQDSTANALTVGDSLMDNAGTSRQVGFKYFMRAATITSTTFNVRAGSSGAATTTFNGFGGARKFGGVLGSYISIKEITA